MRDNLSTASRLVLALVLTNSGGDGKSTWAEVLAALARLNGLSTVVADIDPGNRGYLNRNGDNSALSLDWSLGGSGAKALTDPAAWFDEHLAGRQIGILDTGANMLAAANPINQFVGGLIEVARKQGARIIVYGVTSPHKAGSDELIEIMYQRFRRGAEVVVVQNDRDGSKAFADSISALGTPIVSVPHLAPGLQAVRLRRCIPLDEVLVRPEVEFERATALIAQRLSVMASQDAVIDVIGRGVAARLEALASKAPAATHYRIATLDMADNVSIDANEKMAGAWRQFFQTDKMDTAALLEASVALWDAQRSWDRRHR